MLPFTVRYSASLAENYHEKQIFILLIIYVFKKLVVEPEIKFGYPYTTTKRRIMCSAFTKFANAKENIKSRLGNWELVLKHLENQRRFDFPQTSNA